MRIFFNKDNQMNLKLEHFIKSETKEWVGPWEQFIFVPEEQTLKLKVKSSSNEDRRLSHQTAEKAYGKESLDSTRGLFLLKHLLIGFSLPYVHWADYRRTIYIYTRHHYVHSI